MAHSFIQAYDNEQQAFREFVQRYPDTTLLVDTYDPIEGVKKVIDLRRTMGKLFSVGAIHLDSGDLFELAKRARSMLDDAGLDRVENFASGGLDEYAVSCLIEEGAPNDGFGVGTRMAVSHDLPDMDFTYKLLEYAH